MKNTFLISFALLLALAVYAQNKPVKTPEMVLVKGGTFRMGSETGNDDEKPVHPVTLTSYYIGRYEVTYADFKRFVTATGYITDAEQPDSVKRKNGWPIPALPTGTWSKYANGIPVVEQDSLLPVGNVSWNDAVAFCSWLSKATGKKWRLPTEAEWEFAARGGVESKGYKYAGSNDPDVVAWYLYNANRPKMVGQKLANELGLYDMTGNSREWCADWYDASWYGSSPAKNPQGPSKGTTRVVRGASWCSYDTKLNLVIRSSVVPSSCTLDLGFRVVMDAD